MRCMWERFGKVSKGYTLDDLKELVGELSGNRLPDYFEQFVEGKVPLETKIQELLNTVGYLLKESGSAFISERKFGFKTAISDNKMVVSAIEPGSVAAACLRLHDEIVAVDQRKVTDSIDELLATQDAVHLTIFRQHYLHTFHLVNDGRSFFKQYTIEQKDNASTEEKENFTQWLQCSW